MKLELTLNHRRLDVNSGDVLTNPELVIIDFRSRYKGDSGVYYGNDPTEYDDVWIDPDGSAATADDILASNRQSVQQNIDGINLSLTSANKTITELTKQLPNTLPVKVTGTAAAPAFAFTKADFDMVAKSYANGAQIFVDITDNRSAANKPIDLSARYDALWNKTLSQIEVRDTNIARGFYLNGATPTNRGCITCDTAKYIDAGAEFNALEGLYWLNEVPHTESEISSTYSFTAVSMLNTSWTELLVGGKCKTNFWLSKSTVKGGTAGGVNGTGCFTACGKLVIAKIASSDLNKTYFSFVTSMFSYTPKLNKVIGIIDVLGTKEAAKVRSIFSESSISSFKIARLNTNIAFNGAPNIDRDSVLYLVTNSVNTTPITITLDAEVMSRLTPEDIAFASSRNITLTA